MNMKKLWMIGTAMLLWIGAANAQEWNDLKGPAAKNYKPWKSQARNVTADVRSERSDVQGPEFKNQKPWNQSDATMPVDTTLDTSDKVTGPKAKNKKPWKNN